MEIKVFGSGCTNCKKLHAFVLDAVKELGADVNVIYETDLAEIMKAGIMRTPGLMINGKVKSMGRVLSAKEIKQLITDEN